MKKLFTLIALAMSFMGGYAQGTYKEFTENTLLETTSDFITAEEKNDWVKATGLKAATKSWKKEMTVIDPKTDGDMQVLKLNGVDVKGVARTYSFAISNVAEAKIYFYNISGTATRTFKVQATPEKGSALSESLVIKASTSGRIILSLDKDVKYKISVEGYDEAGTTAADFMLYALKLNTTESLTTAASSFSTYAASYPVDYKSLGLTAYAIGLDEAAKKVTYTEIDGIVPANTPVLVKGEASKTYSLTKATGDAAEVTTSLQVSDGKVVTEGGHYYAFSTVDGKSGFKKLADGITIPAKKGYLKLATANAKGFFAFDDETTGIKGIVNGTIEEEETPLYNLAGQRVSKDYKGVIVKNGKKFFNK